MGVLPDPARARTKAGRLFERTTSCALRTLPALATPVAPLALLALLIAPAARAQTLTVDGSNSPFTLSAATSYGQVTVTDGGTLVVDAPLAVTGDLTVVQGGRVTMSARKLVLRLDVGGALVVGLGASVDVREKGLPWNTTLDPLTQTPVVRSGSAYSRGSHGAAGGSGMGSSGTRTPTMPVFDDPANPTWPGAGGDRSSAVAGALECCAGGGALLVRARRARVDGTIDASAQSSGPSLFYVAGGAGGSINFDVETFEGAGSLVATGGNEGPYGGAGAGGLVRVAFSASTFSGRSSVGPGQSDPDSNAQPGSALFVDRSAGTARVVAGTYPLRGGASFQDLGPAPGATLAVFGAASVAAPVAVPAGATLALRSPHALDALRLGTIDGALVVDDDVETAGELLLNGTLELNRRLTVGAFEAGPLAFVTHDAGVTSLHLVATRTLHLVAGAQVNTVGKGLSPGRTCDPATGAVVAGSALANGGSHGGQGGLANSGAVLAPTYDDPENPRFGGGGGGDNTAGNFGTAGGGVIRLTARELRLDGVLVADGASLPPGRCCGGTGAGGTIVVAADGLSGTGAMLARGSQAPAQSSGGGGGGLIALRTGSSSFAGTLSVAGGLGTTANGADGVIVQRALSVAPTVISTAPGSVRVGDTFTYAPVATGSKPITFSLLEAPDGGLVDADGGVVSWTPSGEGAAVFTLHATNAFGVGEQRFAVSALVEPRVTSQASPVGVAFEPYRYDDDGAASASGTAPLDWTLLVAPAGMTVNRESGVVSWTPQAPGTHLACLEVRNPVGVATQCFAVGVAAAHGDGGTAARGRLAVGCGCAAAPPGLAAHGTAGAPLSFVGLILAAMRGALRHRRPAPRLSSRS